MKKRRKKLSLLYDLSCFERVFVKDIFLIFFRWLYTSFIPNLYEKRNNEFE